MKSVIKVAVIDDHVIFRSGLIALFKDENIEVVLEAENGMDMIDKLRTLKKSSLPDVFIVDVNMPVMNGVETVLWLNHNNPGSKVIILTMYDQPEIVMQLIKLGVKAYLTKVKAPSDLLNAISFVNENKFYFPDEITRIIVGSHQGKDKSHNESANLPSITEREMQILKLLCTEMTYPEIAKVMGVSPRTADAFRQNLFSKLKVKSRVGLVLLAIKLKLVTVSE